MAYTFNEVRHMSSDPVTYEKKISPKLGCSKGYYTYKEVNFLDKLLYSL